MLHQLLAHAHPPIYAKYSINLHNWNLEDCKHKVDLFGAFVVPLIDEIRNLPRGCLWQVLLNMLYILHAMVSFYISSNFLQKLACIYSP
jgi:hypothetical protein